MGIMASAFPPQPPPPPPPTRSQRFVAAMRRIYQPLGFNKGYNFALFGTFAGALVGFACARLMYLNIDGIYCGEGYSPNNRAFPGECFYYRIGIDRIGMLLHLAGILPASLLACLQFVPAIRQKLLVFHRANGYLVLFLSLVGIIGGIIVGRHAAGGTLDSTGSTAVLAIMFFVSLLLAYVNVKRLQIEQHRAWMLRAWFYAGSIITSRAIMYIAAAATSRRGDQYVAMRCETIDFLIANRNDTVQLFPDCTSWAAGFRPGQRVAVKANYFDNSSPVGPAAAIQACYALANWIALIVHAAGVEIYLRLTTAETERLRNVSYQRQMEAGMRNPGRAGLTSDRLGDSEKKWEPASEDSRRESRALTIPEPTVAAVHAGTKSDSETYAGIHRVNDEWLPPFGPPFTSDGFLHGR